MLLAAAQVEDYTQQLTLSAKQLDSPRSHEDHHHHSPRHSYTNSYHHNGKGESPRECARLCR